MTPKTTPTGIERFFDEGDIIVSKTDLKGRITYANKVFCDVAGYTQPELLGQPHSIIRHPDMPRCVFKLLWDTIQNGREVFAYVLNMARNGDHYWVFAHVTPSFDAHNQIIGYHSNRRVPDREVVRNTMTPLYADLLREEARHPNGKDGLDASYRALVGLLNAKNVTYDELIFSL